MLFCCFTKLTFLCMFDLWQFAPCVSAPKVMASEHATNSRTDKNLCGWQGELWVLFPWCSIFTLLNYEHKKKHVFCRQDDGFKWIEIEISTMSVLLHRLVRLCFLRLVMQALTMTIQCTDYTNKRAGDDFWVRQYSNGTCSSFLANNCCTILPTTNDQLNVYQILR